MSYGSGSGSSGGGLPLPPLGLPPLFMPHSSSYNHNNNSSNSNRIDPGAGILPPPRRSRTPSFQGSPYSSTPAGGPSSSSFSTSFDNRYGAFSVPPQSQGTTSADLLTPRMTACLPCKRGHLKCGRGMRPCQQCIKKGRAEDCLEGVPPEQAALFLRLYREKQGLDSNAHSSTRPLTPVFDDTPLFPQGSSSSSPGRRNSSAYPSFCQVASSSSSSSQTPLSYSSDEMPAWNPVTVIMGQDLQIGRVSQDAFRTFGYHPYEMVNKSLSYYFPVTEREKWKAFSGKLFTPLNPGGRPLPKTPPELAQLPMEALAAPVKDMRSIVGHYHFRRYTKEMISVRVELWFGSYFGATTDNFKTFEKAVVVARISPINPQALPSHPPPSMSTFPSVLLPAPAMSTFPSVLLPAPASSGETFAAPRRARTPSLQSGSRLPPLPSHSSLCGSPSRLPPLPPLGSLGDLPPLGALPPLGTFPSPSSSSSSATPRKRRTSAFNAGALDPFDHGSGLGPSTSRPRLRSPTPVSGHRRSVSSEAGQSYSSSSSYDPSIGHSPSASSIMDPLQRAPSRNRRPSNFGPSMFSNGSVPHIPKIMPDSPSKSALTPSASPHSHHHHHQNAPLFPNQYSHYKSRKQSYIAIDDSFNTTSPMERARTPLAARPIECPSLDNHSPVFGYTSIDDKWTRSLPLPHAFSVLSLEDSPTSEGSPTDPRY